MSTLDRLSRGLQKSVKPLMKDALLSGQTVTHVNLGGGAIRSVSVYVAVKARKNITTRKNIDGVTETKTQILILKGDLTKDPTRGNLLQFGTVEDENATKYKLTEVVAGDGLESYFKCDFDGEK